MIKKFNIFFLSMLVSGFLYAQITPPVLSPGEHWTNSWSLSYDYQTNGSVRYIIQDPTNPLNLCAVLMATRDSTSLPAGTNRYVYYSYSSDGGATWDVSADVTNSAFSGFQSLSVTADGKPTISFHLTGTPTSAQTFQDLLFGAGAWTQIGTMPNTPNNMVWPHMCITSNGNIVVATDANPPLPMGDYSFYNGTTWSAQIPIAPNGPSGNFSVEAGPNGSAFIFGTDNAVLDVTRLMTSSDNGATFTLQTGSNAPPEAIMDGVDTMYAFIDGGKSGIYVGSELHLVYSVYANSSEVLATPPNTVWYKKTKIIHWSSSTGVDTVAGRFNMPNMTDTLTHALTNPLCQPSLGIFNGLLYCTYTAFLRGNSQTVNDGSVVNAGEIFLTYSADNGNTWSTPVNITNTPNIEEKHSSVVRNFVLPAGDSIGVYYIRDLKAGGWVNVSTWGPAPVYSIYKKLGGNIIGIHEDLQVAKNYQLFQNYPNPFNPTTTISYNLPKNGHVTLKVYNVLGSLVATIVDGYQTKGAKELNFDGSKLASGIYYYTLDAGDFKDTKKMVLIK